MHCHKMTIVNLSCIILPPLLSRNTGGAGGKGVWGRSGEVYEPEEVDEKDPNYDEAQVLNAVLKLYICIMQFLNSMIAYDVDH